MRDYTMKRFLRNYFLLFTIAAFAAMFIVLYSSLTHQAVSDVNRRFTLSMHQIQYRLSNELLDFALQQKEQNSSLLSKAKILATEIAHDPEKIKSHDWILEMGKTLGVSSLCISDESGVLIAATDEGFIGFRMDSSEQSAEFMPACKNQGFELVQEPSLRGIDRIPAQYAGVGRIDRPGIVQVCKEYTTDFTDTWSILQGILLEQTLEHDIILVVPEKTGWTSTTPIMASSLSSINGKEMGYAGFTMTSLSKAIKINGKYFYARNCGSIIAGKDEYPLLACISVENMFGARNRILMISSILFAILACITYFAIMHTMQTKIIEPIYRINTVMEQVIAGDLHINIEEKHLPEFAALSDSINTTVAELLRRNRIFRKQVSGEREISRSILNTINDLKGPLFPNIKSVDFSAFFEQSEMLGADYVQFLSMDDGSPAFIIADSSGSGVAACLYMMKFRAILQKCIKNGICPPLSDLPKRLREGLAAEQDLSNLYLSAFFGHYIPETHTLEYINAGYMPPMLKYAGTTDIDRIRAEKVKAVLSAKTNVTDELLSIQLEPGDFFFAFSDGFVRCVNDKNELYTVDRLETEFAKLDKNATAAEAIRSMNEARKKFCGEKHLDDDVALVAMKVLQ